MNHTGLWHNQNLIGWKLALTRLTVRVDAAACLCLSRVHFAVSAISHFHCPLIYIAKVYLRPAHERVANYVLHGSSSYVPYPGADTGPLHMTRFSNRFFLIWIGLYQSVSILNCSIYLYELYSSETLIETQKLRSKQIINE